MRLTELHNTRRPWSIVTIKGRKLKIPLRPLRQGNNVCTICRALNTDENKQNGLKRHPLGYFQRWTGILLSALVCQIKCKSCFSTILQVLCAVMFRKKTIDWPWDFNLFWKGSQYHYIQYKEKKKNSSTLIKISQMYK